jgi:hypothetical protein
MLVVQQPAILDQLAAQGQSNIRVDAGDNA